MEKYAIHCTEAQTKKALELGAPIMLYKDIATESAPKGCFIEDNTLFFIPTAEQMISWLEEQGIFVHIEPCFDICCSWHIASKGFNKYGYTSSIMVCNTRKEATLAAIDAALDYLSKNKK